MTSLNEIYMFDYDMKNGQLASHLLAVVCHAGESRGYIHSGDIGAVGAEEYVGVCHFAIEILSAVVPFGTCSFSIVEYFVTIQSVQEDSPQRN